LIQNKILNSVASLIIEQGVQRGGTIQIGFNAKTNEFTHEVKKTKKSDKQYLKKESLVA
jgi:hypothetical protein